MRETPLGRPPRGTTRDTLFGGSITLVQPARGRGYRFNVDAVLLAYFATKPSPARHAFDIGAGVGAVGFSLLHFGGARNVTLVEIDPTLARLARRNASAPRWASRVSVSCAGAREASLEYAARADLVVCNPPYTPPGRGRTPLPTRARSRVGSIGEFLGAARTLLGRRSRLCLIYPAIELATLIVGCRDHGLEPKRMRFVFGKPKTHARVVLVECVAGKPGGLVVEPPLVETDGRGKPNVELAALLA